jgi:hypothetical protein
MRTPVSALSGPVKVWREESFRDQPRETMQSLRIGVFEMRGIARTYSRPRTIPLPKNTTATTPIQTRLLLNAALNFRLTFCGEIDDGLGTAQGVLSQFDPTPAGKVTIVTKGDSSPMLGAALFAISAALRVLECPDARDVKRSAVPKDSRS